jgi:hypothetical protein
VEGVVVGVGSEKRRDWAGIIARMEGKDGNDDRCQKKSELERLAVVTDGTT